MPAGVKITDLPAAATIVGTEQVEVVQAGVSKNVTATGLMVPHTALTGTAAHGLGTLSTQAASAVAITGGTITGITDLAIADGGTGSSTAADARTALGSTAVGDAVFVSATAAAARTAIGAVIGTDVQAYDATLTSLSALGTAANKVAYTTGVDTWAETPLTAAGRALIDDASAAAQRTTLGSTSVGDAVFIADSTAAARTAIEAAGTGVANTFVGGQSFGTGSGNVDTIIDGGVAIRALRYRTGGLERFAAFVNSTAESGSNAGSDFAFARYDDAGAFIDLPLTIRRSDGGVTIASPTGGAKGSGTLNAVNLYVQNSAVLKQSDIFVSADQTITLAGALTLAHGLGAAPRIKLIELVCQTAELGYSIGDVIQAQDNTAMILPDATNLNIRYRSASIGVMNKTTGVFTSITAANWKARFLAIK